MQDVNVVVIFHSRFGVTERLAMSAAVGAVNGRALIRLRLLPDAVTPGGWEANRAQMDKEFIAPRPADIKWADAILFGMPGAPETLPPEFERFLGSVGTLEGKLCGCFTGCPAVDALYQTLSRLGATTVPVLSAADPVENARGMGRQIAEAARERRAQK